MLEAHAAGGGGGGDYERGDKRDLVDKRFFTPDPLSNKDIFRKWSDDFTDYIRSRDVEMGTLLESCKYSDVAVTSSSSSAFAAIDSDKVRNLYRVMKKLLKEHGDARPLVKHVMDRNPFEAWRQIHAKLDPINDQAASHAVKTILNPKHWAVSHVSQIPLMLARWEGLQREHTARTQERVLTPSSARAFLLEMIPVKLTDHIRTQTLLVKREDLTYDKAEAVHR